MYTHTTPSIYLNGSIYLSSFFEQIVKSLGVEGNILFIVEFPLFIAWQQNKFKIF